MTTLLHAEEQVLSTLEKDGRRRWLKPTLSHGRFLRRRRIVAYILIAIFTLLPWVQINGKPLILLDVAARRFTLLGYTFLPTDTVLLALLLLSLLLGIFLLTALFGRVWCGWACPQTVYLEFVYRPIERLLDGTVGRGGKARQSSGLRQVVRYGIYLLISLLLAHTFLAYFVGVERLFQWMRQSPLEHPTPFLVMVATTGLMMFDFCFFREQLCIIACPYGRLQSVLLDRLSLIIGYDIKRGEPRGKVTRHAADAERGDCVDCLKCVATCPAGIDIRKGLQMECIGCAQCIDACDSVMAKLNRPTGLIRYSSQTSLAGEPVRRMRPRVMIYPALLAIVLTILAVLLVTKAPADVTLLRNLGSPFMLSDEGQVRNSLRLKITNRTDAPATYRIELVEPHGAVIAGGVTTVELQAGEVHTEAILIEAPPEAFRAGAADVTLVVTDGKELELRRTCRLLGPMSTNANRGGER